MCKLRILRLSMDTFWDRYITKYFFYTSLFLFISMMEKFRKRQGWVNSNVGKWADFSQIGYARGHSWLHQNLFALALGHLSCWHITVNASFKADVNQKAGTVKKLEDQCINMTWRTILMNENSHVSMTSAFFFSWLKPNHDQNQITEQGEWVNL